jgi:hypothetical protein
MPNYFRNNLQSRGTTDSSMGTISWIEQNNFQSQERKSLCPRDIQSKESTLLEKAKDHACRSPPRKRSKASKAGLPSALISFPSGSAQQWEEGAGEKQW